MDKIVIYLLLSSLLTAISNPICGQASKERKLIVGSWLSEEKSHQLDFKANGECVEVYAGSKVTNTYTYRISDTMPDCDPKETMIIDPKEKVTFLEMIEKETGLKFCYEINGFTDATLSLRMLGRGGYILLNRKKPNRVKVT